MMFTKRIRDAVRRGDSGNNIYLVRFHYIPSARSKRGSDHKPRA